MSKVKLDTPAPDFSLEDFRGRKVSLSDFHDKKNVIVVLNRGFS